MPLSIIDDDAAIFADTLRHADTTTFSFLRDAFPIYFSDFSMPLRQIMMPLPPMISLFSAFSGGRHMITDAMMPF